MRLLESTLLAGLLACLACPPGEAGELKLQKSVPLPGVSGRFDHAAMDAKTHRLFFAALGNDTLEIVDVETGKRVHSIGGLKKPTGVAFLPEQNLIAVANGDDGTCRFFDGVTYVERGRVSGLDDADNLRFDPVEKRLYLGYGDGAIGVIDPVAMKLVGTIPLAKHPESFQLEENGARIFVNVPGARQIAVVDRRAGRVVSTWKLEDVRANFPMALAEKEHRIFVACRWPARLLAFDTETGKRVADSEMSGDADDLFCNAETREIVASCGEGFLDVFHFTPSGSLNRTGRVASRSGARTSFLDRGAKALYLAMPHQIGHDAEIAIYQTEGGR